MVTWHEWEISPFFQLERHMAISRRYIFILRDVSFRSTIILPSPSSLLQERKQRLY